MKIQVHIKQQSTVISCGNGNNTIRWLADSALIWYIDHSSCASNNKKQKILSTPIKIAKNNGLSLDMNEKISKVLQNNDAVYVYLKEQVEWQNLGKGD